MIANEWPTIATLSRKIIRIQICSRKKSMREKNVHEIDIRSPAVITPIADFVIFLVIIEREKKKAGEKCKCEFFFMLALRNGARMMMEKKGSQSHIWLSGGGARGASEPVCAIEIVNVIVKLWGSNRVFIAFLADRQRTQHTASEEKHNNAWL